MPVASLLPPPSIFFLKKKHALTHISKACRHAQMHSAQGLARIAPRPTQPLYLYVLWEFGKNLVFFFVAQNFLSLVLVLEVLLYILLELLVDSALLTVQIDLGDFCLVLLVLLPDVVNDGAD